MARSNLRNFVTHQEFYFREHQTYATDVYRLMHEAGVRTPTTEVMSVIKAGKDGYALRAVNRIDPSINCVVFMGPLDKYREPPARYSGVPKCE